MKRFGQRKGAEINDTHCVAFAIGDVCVLAKRRAVVGDELLSEIPPSETAEDG